VLSEKISAQLALQRLRGNVGEARVEAGPELRSARCCSPRHVMRGPGRKHGPTLYTRKRISPPYDRHMTQRMLNPGFLNESASYDVSSNVCRAYLELVLLDGCGEGADRYVQLAV